MCHCQADGGGAGGAAGAGGGRGPSAAAGTRERDPRGAAPPFTVSNPYPRFIQGGWKGRGYRITRARYRP